MTTIISIKIQKQLKEKYIYLCFNVLIVVFTNLVFHELSSYVTVFQCECISIGNYIEFMYIK